MTTIVSSDGNLTIIGDVIGGSSITVVTGAPADISLEVKKEIEEDLDELEKELEAEEEVTIVRTTSRSTSSGVNIHATSVKIGGDNVSGDNTVIYSRRG